ncbi:YceI family protein [Sphingobacterium psychroaquaticum]|uniref:Polyisoprenoid-binding protein YceI n=1 Tax=Sphingobacterium psychroaquaticum TaxID=561061 RepID=A0A1X7L7F6_9SPHI|nr:YceI family protein [Sphingobacterium psychroaquaticum]SMG49172.1 Polyisoprenoid-binding protein YceI [Sphingobacterium psychroaquaticum]
MKKLTLLLALLISVCSYSFAQKSTLKLDPKASNIQWDAKKVVGGHVGTIAIKNGQISIDKNKIVGGEFMIDMNSLQCTDSPKATGHLKNEDFFNVPQYPSAKFVITKVDHSKSTPTVTGNLTIKDKTKSISFPINVVRIGGNEVEAEAKNVKINRLDFDIKYRSSSFFADLGDKAIEDYFTLNILVKATK